MTPFPTRNTHPHNAVGNSSIHPEALLELGGDDDRSNRSAGARVAAGRTVSAGATGANAVHARRWGPRRHPPPGRSCGRCGYFDSARRRTSAARGGPLDRGGRGSGTSSMSSGLCPRSADEVRASAECGGSDSVASSVFLGRAVAITTRAGPPQEPVLPSVCSRRMSACPTCLAVSSIMCM